MFKVSFKTLSGDKSYDDLYVENKHELYHYLFETVQDNLNYTKDFVIIRMLIDNIELNYGIHDIDINKIPILIDDIIITVIKQKPSFKTTEKNMKEFYNLMTNEYEIYYIKENKKIFSKYFLDDIIAITLLTIYPTSVNFASEDLRDNSRIMLDIMNWSVYHFISPRLKNDYNFILEVIKKDGSIFPELNDEFKKDKKIIFNALTSNRCMLSYLNQIFYREYILEFIDYNIIDYEYLSDIFTDDKEIIFKLIKHKPKIYRYIIDKLKDDKDIILEIIDRDSTLLKYATDNFFDTYMNKLKIFI